MQRTRQAPWLAAAVVLLASGCIECDEVTTLTVQPDGAAEWVRFRSDVHSTEAGEKGQAELRRYVEEFDARSSSECVRLGDVGGELVESRWIRREEPYADLLRAHLPAAAVLERFYTYTNDAGDPEVRARFTKDGARRRLSWWVIFPTPEHPPVQPDAAESAADRADGFSEFRVAVTGGTVTAARGFAIAKDGRSALVDRAEVADVLRHATEQQVEFFVEWHVAEG